MPMAETINRQIVEASKNDIKSNSSLNSNFWVRDNQKVKKPF